MTSQVSTVYKRGLLLAAGALFAALIATPATAGFAQSSQNDTQLLGRINQLENQVQTLSRALYRGGKMPAPVEAVPMSGGGEGAIANFEVRLSQIEDQQRQMTGQLEKINYDLEQMKMRLDKTLTDNEMRFQQMEGRSGSAASAPSSYTPASSGGYGQQGAIEGVGGESLSGGTLGTMTSRGGDPADVLYEDAFSDVRNAKYESAANKLKQFMSLYASHPLAGNAQYWLAETHYVRGDYRQAAKLFAQGYQDYPQGAKAADSLLKLGLSLSRLGKKDDACLALQQLKKEFPSEQSAVTRRALQEMKTLGCG